MSSLLMAAQFTGTKGRSARGLRAWMARATSSLPVPDSPRMVTAAEEGATRSIRSMRTFIAGSVPTRPCQAAGASLRAGVAGSTTRSVSPR